MKKVLLVFISILTFSFLLVNNNVNAQTFPTFSIKLPFSYISFVQENTNTYEYEVYYQVSNDVFSNIDINEYFFTTISYIPIRKLTNRNTNSYELIGVNSPPTVPYSIIIIRVTLLKTFVNDYFSNDPSSDIYIANFFRDASALYALYVGGQGSVDYDKGYNEGFETGRQTGYDLGYDVGFDEGRAIGRDEGYDEGYDIGFDEGRDEGFESGRKTAIAVFTENFHIWFIPAIIIVFAIGVFVSYRKGRDE